MAEAASNIDLAFLARVPLFEGLSLEELHRVVSIARWRNWGAGEIIIREGEGGDTLYVLLSGAVEVTKTLTLRLSQEEFGEREKTLMRSDSREPFFFGEMAMLEGTERSATVTTTAPCETLEIERKDFLALAEAESRIGYLVLTNIAKMLSSRLRRTNMDVLKLTTALSLALGGR